LCAGIGLVLAFASTAGAGTIALGADYFSTTSASYDFGGSIGVVDFVGLPCGPGCTPPNPGPANTDMIIEREGDATINGGAVTITMDALSLKSTNPVNIGGSFYDVFLTLLQDNSEGSLGVTGTLAGGTYSSFLDDLDLQATFRPTGGGSVFEDVLINNLQLSQSVAAWSPTPPPNALIFNAPNHTYEAQFSNQHSGLDANEVDFFLNGSATWEGDGLILNETLATVPEPATWVLLLGGLTALAAFHRDPRTPRAGLGK
jgi:hypothetical protein